MRKINPVAHQKKRQDILDAAKRCMSREGVRNASIADICTEAGISAGNLYHYFDSKEAIIMAIFESRVRFAQERFEAVGSDVDFIGKLHHVLDLMLASELRSFVLVHDLIAEAARSPAIGALFQSHQKRLRALVSNMVRDAQKRHQVDESHDPEMAASVLIGMFDGIRVMRVRDPRLDIKKARKYLAVMIERFLNPPPH